MTARTFTLPVQAVPATGGAPWNQGQAVNTWREISNTKLSDQPTMPAPNGAGGVVGKQNAWVGWCIDRSTNDVYSVGQGGHNDYFGNEVNRISLSAAAPAWSQLVAPSLSSTIPGTPGYAGGAVTDGYYSDGKPVATHGYTTCQFIPSINRAIRFPGGSKTLGGEPIQTVTVFNANTGLYDSQTIWNPITTPASLSAGSFAYAMHPTTEAVYWWNNNAQMWRWNVGIPGSWTQMSGFPPTNTKYSGAAVDTTRNKVFFLGHNAEGSVSYLYDIATNTYQAITLTGTNLATVPLALVYVPTTDKYYACVNHSIYAQVYVITPVTGSTTWTCTALNTGTTGSNIPLHAWTPGANTGDMPFTKFLYAPSLGGCIYGPKWLSNLFFLKLH